MVSIAPSPGVCLGCFDPLGPSEHHTPEKCIANLRHKLGRTCIPVDVELFGWKKLDCIPEPTDVSVVGGVLTARVKLTPERPLAQVTLAGGKYIRICGWANQCDLSARCPHEGKVRKLEEENWRLREQLREALDILQGALT